MDRFREHRLGRQLALQFLYGLDFNELEWRLALPEFWAMDPVSLSLDLSGDLKENGANQDDDAGLATARAFAETLIEGICATRNELDALLAEALDNWRPERVGRVEWVILRMSLYELQHCPENPEAVIIHEANRLATLFGNEESPRFVSGVLNRFLENKESRQENPSCPATESPE